jgi:hypothetical protein
MLRTVVANIESSINLSPYLSELDFYNSPVGNIEFDELDF